MAREGGQWSMDDLTQLKWVTIQQGRRSILSDRAQLSAKRERECLRTGI